MALGRKTGGRKKGTPNKRPSVTELIAQSGMDPIQKMMDLMMNSLDENIQLQSAKELAQYVYKKRSQEVHLTGKITHEVQQHIEEMIDLSEEQLDLIIEEEQQKLLTGKTDE